MSDYMDCGCRDCFEIAIGVPGDMCHECVAAGCETDSECQREEAKSLKPKPLACQWVRAPNDKNGNPRRVWLVYGKDGTPIEVIDEGCAGMPKRLRELPELPTMDVSPTAYKGWLKFGSEQRCLTRQ